MFFFYQLIIFIVIIFSPIIILFRIIKKKEDIIRFKEKFGIKSIKRKTGKLIWFHGSSVGEIMSILPLIDYYENNNSINQILITSSTLSSAKILKKFKFKKTIHQFFPIDFFFITNIFLSYWKPSIAIFIESEIWPCFFKNLNKKKIPLVLINARITKKSFNKWLLLEKYAQSIFRYITISYPQNFETFQYLKKLKVKKIKSIGNLKFVKNPYDTISNLGKKLNLLFSRHKIWVAASTHENEEIIAARAHIILKRKVKNLITIIIPRHINRTNEIFKKIKNMKLKVICHSSKKITLNKVDIYLVDTYGETKKFYKLSKTVFLGGSLINHGGQNPLEPARYGAKILHGKNIQNFKEVYNYLKKLNLSQLVNNSEQLAKAINFKTSNKKAIKIIKLGGTILKNTTTELNSLIKNAN